MMINVRKFGAVGDGIATDTAAIQRAIEHGSRTSETVVFSPGIYKSGTLLLRDNLSIYLEAGARLLGSPDITDYITDTAVTAETFNHYLLWGDGICNLSIKGLGSIDGAGYNFWGGEYIGGGNFEPGRVYDPAEYKVLIPLKPRVALIYIRNSKQISFEDITVENSPGYTVWTLGCDDLSFRRMTIRNPYFGPNTDAFDIDCCSNVEIDRCDIRAGDDCVALKSDAYRLGCMKPCQDIRVTNCRMSSTACAIRIGFEGDAPIRDAIFKNIQIYDSEHGINMLSVSANRKFTKIITGTPIFNIMFDNISMTNVKHAIYCFAGDTEGQHSYSAEIANMVLQRIRAESFGGSYIGSNKGIPIHDVILRNVVIKMKRTRPDTTVDYPENCWKCNNLSAVLALRGVNRITLEKVNLLSSESDNPIMITEKVQEITQK